MIKLGPFEVHEPVGQGGMARVWRGIHPERQVHVALKVMIGEPAADPHFQRAFRDEIRAVARLDHPGIIRVYDYGIISPEAARASGDTFISGSPYLAMELAICSLAESATSSMGFAQQRILLLRLLDALAYAHARGVIHRDLKPGNVLVVSDGGGPALKLADFGLAHALHHDGEEISPREGAFSGTPRFIAPEQIQGRWRDQGPWTDLYALGCIAYWLCTGSPPFIADDDDEILRLHLSEEPPPLPPGDWPPEYPHLLQRLLAKNSWQRFQHAADAAHALRQIGKTSSRTTGSSEPPSLELLLDDLHDSQPALLADETLVLPEFQELKSQPPPPLASRGGTFLPDIPRPPSWRRPLERLQHHRRAPLSSLGLFGLRQAPMVDREEERDLLWQALQKVKSSGKARAAIILGDAGTGKTRLIESIAERAHEVGAATILRAGHGPMSGPTDGLSRLVSNHLRCAHLSREETLARVRSIHSQKGPLDADDLFDCLALTQIIAPDAPDAESSTTPPSLPDPLRSTKNIHFNSPGERYSIVARFLSTWAEITARPILVSFDDLQWGGDAIRFTEYFLSSSAPDAPVLFLLAARQEALASRPDETTALQRLRTHSAVTDIAIAPLSEEDHRALIDGLLPLHEELASALTRRTCGNPLFASQLIADWVARDALLPSPDGYRLRPGEEALLPDNIHQLLLQRIAALLQNEPPERAEESGHALELAAAIGRAVDRREWEEACRLSGLTPPLQTLEAIFSAAMATPLEKGWLFVHEALRESLQRMATDGRRWQRHHQICVEMLDALYHDERPGLAIRRARHLIAAGRPADALEPLLHAAQQALAAAEPHRSFDLLDQREALLKELASPSADPRRVEGELLRTYISWTHRQHEQAAQELHFHLVRSRRFGWTRLSNDCLYYLAAVHRDQGSHQEAMDFTLEAMEGYHADQDSLGVAKCLHNLAALYQTLGLFQDSEQNYRKAIAIFESMENKRGLALCRQGLAALVNRQGRFDEGYTYLQSAQILFEEVGDRLGLSNTLNTFGEWHRHQGNLDEAIGFYRRSVSLRKRLGTQNFFIPFFNLAISLMLQDRFQEAHQEIRHLTSVVESSQKSSLIGIVHTGALTCCAALGLWKKFDKHLRIASHHHSETGIVDKDLAFLFETAAAKALQARHPERARAAASQALLQFQGIHHDEGIQRTRAFLSSL